MPAVFGLQQLNSRARAPRWILAPATGGVLELNSGTERDA